MNDCIIGVAGNIKHFHLWTKFEQALCEFASAHLLENDISEQHIDLALMSLAHEQSFTAVACFEHVVSMLVQNLTHERTHSVFIFYQENCFTAAARGLLRTRERDLHCRIDSRQVDLECGSAANLAIYPNIPTTL